MLICIKQQSCQLLFFSKIKILSFINIMLYVYVAQAIFKCLQKSSDEIVIKTDKFWQSLNCVTFSKHFYLLTNTLRKRGVSRFPFFHLNACGLSWRCWILFFGKGQIIQMCAVLVCLEAIDMPIVARGTKIDFGIAPAQ